MLRLTAIVKATFAFVDQDVARLIDPIAIGLRDRHFDNNPRRSTYESFELSPYVPGVGVTLVGTAYPPDGHLTPSMSVRLGIYADETPVLEKTLHVFGERSAENPQVSRPLTPMPLVYERAIGGRENLAGSPLYNLVSPSEPSKPACFAPVPLAWRALGGRGLDPQTMKSSPIVVPDGFDFAFFRAAPRDQCVARLEGDEWVLLDGMSPRSPRIQTRLPGATARALFRPLLGGQWSAPTDLPLQLDTVAIDAEDETLSLLFRGHIVLDERTTAVHVLAGIELPSAPLVWPAATDAGARRAGSGEHPRAVTFGAPPSAVREARPAVREESPVVHATMGVVPAESESAVRPEGDLPPKRKSSLPPGLQDEGIFGTVVGTIDEILASMPALPFEGSGAPPKHDAPDESAVHAIPATPWDGGASHDPGSTRVVLPTFDVEETMDVTAVRRLLEGQPAAAPNEPAFPGGFEDMGTVVGGDDLLDSRALPFLATGPTEPARPPPLGLPKALPFEERAPEEPESPARPVMTKPKAPAPPPSVTMTGPLAPKSAATPFEVPVVSTPAVVVPAVVVPAVVAPAVVAPTVVAPAVVAPAVVAPAVVTPSGVAPAIVVPALAPAVADVAASRRSEATAQGAPSDERSVVDVDTSDAEAVGMAEDSKDTAVNAAPARMHSEAPAARVEAAQGEVTDGGSMQNESSVTSGGTRDSLIGPPDAAAKLRREVQSRLEKDESLHDLSLVGVNLSGLDLSGRNLSGLDLSAANLTRAVLKGARLSRTKLEGATLSFAALEEVDFEGADLRRAVLEGARLSGARLGNADFSHASAPKASFEGVRGRGARFVEAKLESSDFSRADLVEVDLTKAQAQRARFEGARFVDGILNDIVADGANFDRADLTRAKLERAGLRRAYLVGTTLADATLENADLTGVRGARAVFDGANLEHATLDGAELTGASFSKAVVKGANAAGARFDGAKLDEADLRLSKLAEAKLVGASLTGAQAGRADFSKADLSKADLSGASFRAAKMTEARLANATLDRADFRDAHLARADLSGCDRESARFAGANLDGVEG